MLEKLVEEMKKIVDEVKSPFSYIHDKLVEAFGHVHKEIEELKARIQLLEGGPATMEELHAQANVLRQRIAEASKKPEGEATVHSVDEQPGSPAPASSERISYPAVSASPTAPHETEQEFKHSPESSPPLPDHAEADK